MKTKKYTLIKEFLIERPDPQEPLILKFYENDDGDVISKEYQLDEDGLPAKSHSKLITGRINTVDQIDAEVDRLISR